jgi:hypothetical protein
MPTVPVDEAVPGRWRLGPFGIEERNGPLWAAAVIVATVLALFAVAAILSGA